MPDLTPDLAELRRLAEAATQGPWAARYGVSWEARVCATTGSLADVNSTANAELIVAAVNALPTLLDVAAERDALAADADKWQRAALTLQGEQEHAVDPRAELLAEELHKLVADFQANGNSRVLGDPTAGAWFEAAQQVLDALNNKADR